MIERGVVIAMLPERGSVILKLSGVRSDFYPCPPSMSHKTFSHGPLVDNTMANRALVIDIIHPSVQQ
jgi:hypothetical protein